MRDTISRQAAVDEIEYELEMIDSDLDSITWGSSASERLLQRKVEAREILNSIQQLPSAEPQWIPCSERLPDKDGRYLVAYWLMKDYMWTDIVWFGKASMPNRPMQGRYFYISGDGVDVVWDGVLAWMPLPKPYREDGEAWMI